MYVPNTELKHIPEEVQNNGETIESPEDEETKSTDVSPKETVCEESKNCYTTPKKKIIAAMNSSHHKSNNKITVNDVTLSTEKEPSNGCIQSVKLRLDLGETLAESNEVVKPKDPVSTPVKGEEKHNRSNKENKIADVCTDDPNLLCLKCGKKEEKKWVHEDCKGKCCKSTYVFCDHCVRHKISSRSRTYGLLRDLKYGKYMYIVKCPNGGGYSLHMDFERIAHLKADEQRELAKEFLKQAFKEDRRGFALFTIAVVHNGARYMPDLLKLTAELRPTLPVKTTKLKCNIETEVMDLGTYYSKVKETYNNGTYAFNPLNETQIASVKNDECGAYMPELLSLLEKSPFLNRVLPWGDSSTKKCKTPHESDDGPIIWCRPGEQIVSLDRNSKRNRWKADEIEAFLKERKQNLKDFSEKRMIVEELKKYRRSYSSREFLFEDRTRPHADQVWGNNFEPTAAVGVIQAIHPDESPEQNSACKEIIVFHAKHFEILEALLHIDVTAAPKQQCAEWLDDAKLNMIRQMKIGYSKMHLYDNDIYFIPRKIVHQFKTISATLSIAWHIRLMQYYRERSSHSSSHRSGSSKDATAASSSSEKKSSSKSSSSHSSSSHHKEHVSSGETNNGHHAKKKKPRSRSKSRDSHSHKTPKKKSRSRSRSLAANGHKSSTKKKARSRSRTPVTEKRDKTSASRKRKEKHKTEDGEASGKRVKTDNENCHRNHQTVIKTEARENVEERVGSEGVEPATIVKSEPMETTQSVEQKEVAVLCPRVEIVDIWGKLSNDAGHGKHQQREFGGLVDTNENPVEAVDASHEEEAKGTVGEVKTECAAAE